MTDTPKIVALETPKQQASKDVERMVEDLLARVRSGEVVSVAYVAMKPDTNFITSFSAGGNWIELVGALDIVRYRMLARYDGLSVTAPKP